MENACLFALKKAGRQALAFSRLVFSRLVFSRMESGQ